MEGVLPTSGGKPTSTLAQTNVQLPEEAAQQRDWQDDLSVSGLLVDATQEFGDGPDGAGKFGKGLRYGGFDSGSGCFFSSGTWFSQVPPPFFRGVLALPFASKLWTRQ